MRRPRYQAVDQFHLGTGVKQGLLVLETVPRANLDQADMRLAVARLARMRCALHRDLPVGSEEAVSIMAGFS